MSKTEIYGESPKASSRCRCCGDTSIRYVQGKGRKSNKQFAVPRYFRVFQKVGWFRGDDEYLGRYCKDCLETIPSVEGSESDQVAVQSGLEELKHEPRK